MVISGAKASDSGVAVSGVAVEVGTRIAVDVGMAEGTAVPVAGEGVAGVGVLVSASTVPAASAVRVAWRAFGVLVAVAVTTLGTPVV